MDFKQIRNKLRKFTYESLVIHLLTILKEQENIISKPSPFWHPLLLLKWTLEFAEDNRDSKVAERNDVIKLIKGLEGLERSHATFDLKRNGRLSKTFTILSFQQFQYQKRIWYDTFARQIYLFTLLRHKYDVEKSFQEKTGLTIIEFIKSLNVFWVSVINSELSQIPYAGFVTQVHISILNSFLGQDKTNSLVSLLTVSRESIQSILEKDSRAIRNYDLQIFETSFFTKRPFLLFRDRLIIPHRDILNHAIHYFIYEFMKNHDERFPEEFGDRMEKYIQLGLEENKIEFVPERELKNILGKESKVVDFVVEKCVLIEAKAVEPRPIVSVNPTDENLAKELSKNIVKAYAIQMLTVANSLQGIDEYFGVIITYKDLYLGETEDIWEQFLRDEIMKIIRDEKDLEKLPADNLFFIDLATWDLMMQIVKSKGVTVKDILLKVRTERRTTRLFSLHMYLDSYEIKRFDLSYLDKSLILDA